MQMEEPPFQIEFHSDPENKLRSMILFPQPAILRYLSFIYWDNTKINPYYYSKNRGQNSAIRSK